MNRKSKRYDEGGLTAEEKAKKDLFSGKAAPDESDTYAPKTRSFSETGPEPEKKKSKPKEPKASQDDAFPKKDREKDDKPEPKGSQNSPLNPRAKEKEKEKDPDAYKKTPEGTPGKKYGIGPHGAFGDVERFLEKNFKTPAQHRHEQKAPKKMAKGGSASSRGDGIAQRGKTKGKII